MTDDEARELKRLEAELASRGMPALPAANAVDEKVVVDLATERERQRVVEAESRIGRQQYLDQIAEAQRESRAAHQRYLSDHPYLDEE